MLFAVWRGGRSTVAATGSVACWGGGCRPNSQGERLLLRSLHPNVASSMGQIGPGTASSLRAGVPIVAGLSRAQVLRSGDHSHEGNASPCEEPFLGSSKPLVVPKASRWDDDAGPARSDHFAAKSAT